MSPFALPLSLSLPTPTTNSPRAESDESPLLERAIDALPLNHLDPRQASIVTQTVMASTGISAPTTAASSSSSSGGGFPFAVAIPALIGGMALACLGALGWWWYQRRRRREQRKRWEARQRRQQRKRANTTGGNTARPSFSSSRPVNGRSASNEKEGEKEVPPMPAVPTVAYGQQNGYQYGGSPAQNQGQSQQPYGNQLQPGIDYGYQREPVDEKSLDRSYAEEYLSAATSTSPNPDIVVDNDASDQPTSPTKESGSSKSKSSRSAKRIEVAENAAAREAADPMTRWKPNKPSPLALAAEKKKAEAAAAAAAAASGKGYAPPLSAGMHSNFEYEETLATPNDPYAGYDDAPSPNPNGSNYLDVNRQEGNGSSRQVSGEWGIAGGAHDIKADIANQSYGGAYTNDPYLAAPNMAGAQRLPSGQYSVDPYAIYHNRDSAEAGKGLQPKVETKKIGGGWV